jgi:hypothetical protein
MLGPGFPSEAQKQTANHKWGGGGESYPM